MHCMGNPGHNTKSSQLGYIYYIHDQKHQYTWTILNMFFLFFLKVTNHVMSAEELEKNARIAKKHTKMNIKKFKNRKRWFSCTNVLFNLHTSVQYHFFTNSKQETQLWTPPTDYLAVGPFSRQMVSWTCMKIIVVFDDVLGIQKTSMFLV